MRYVWVALLCGCQCGPTRLVGVGEEEVDAGRIVARDAGFDAGGGAEIDAGLDAGLDAGVDAGADAGLDAGVDAGPEVPAGGREFWSLILGYQLFGFFGGNSFAVTVANTGTATASVSIEGGMLTGPQQFLVAPNTVSTQTLSDRNPSSLFHIRSTEPVTVVQFNPLHAVSSGTHTYSCDASLLRPVSAWGTRYLVASWPPFGSSPSLIGIAASVDNTTLTITSRATGLPATLVIDAGTLLELSSTTDDLTGTLISADHPIEVIGGHYGAKIPATVDAADHLEESMPPIDALATEYFVVSPALLTIPNGKPQVTRIVAAEPDVELSYEPPVLGAPTHLQHVGDFVELAPIADVYRLRATGKVLVAQYMQSQDVGGGMGDPAMTLAQSPARFSSRYVFHAPIDYDANALDVVAPVGLAVTLDGVALSGFVPIGNTGYALARVLALDDGPTANGDHLVVGTAPFMISVYGYGQYTSYWHPGR